MVAKFPSGQSSSESQPVDTSINIKSPPNYTNKFPMDVNQKRVGLVVQALRNYQNGVFYFDPAKDKIHVELLLTEGVAEPSKENLLEPIRNQFNNSDLRGEAATIKTDDIDLVILRGEGPIIEFHGETSRR